MAKNTIVRWRSALRVGCKLCALGIVIWSASPVQAQTPVTACGTTVSGDAVLVGDLDCSGLGDDQTAITLEGRASLDLAGFTLTGAATAIGDTAIGCRKRCSVLGPGTVAGGSFAVYGFRTTKSGAVRATTVEVDGVDFVDQRNRAVHGKRVTVKASSIVNAGRVGVTGAKIKLTDTVVTGGGNGSQGAQPAVVATKKLSSRGCTVTGNAVGGLSSLRRLTDVGSTVTDNQTDAVLCASNPGCADISAAKRPRLEGTVCGTSWVRGTDAPAENWGLCADD